MNTLNSRMSFAASSSVKQRLREKIYGKLMDLGASYRESVSSSEAVQISTEGVEQLEFIWKICSPVFLQSAGAADIVRHRRDNDFKSGGCFADLCSADPLAIVAVQKLAKKCWQNTGEPHPSGGFIPPVSPGTDNSENLSG